MLALETIFLKSRPISTWIADSFLSFRFSIIRRIPMVGSLSQSHSDDQFFCLFHRFEYFSDYILIFYFFCFYFLLNFVGFARPEDCWLSELQACDCWRWRHWYFLVSEFCFTIIVCRGILLYVSHLRVGYLIDAMGEWFISVGLIVLNSWDWTLVTVDQRGKLFFSVDVIVLNRWSIIMSAFSIQWYMFYKI